MATDQFCLRWNNFQVNITSALESLKSDEDLVDVTLTCEGQNVKAHKVILSACSPYFRNVFKENPCQHPVVILKDVKYEDVTALLNFMYQGEVYITQDRLAPFLHTAELLQVRGLTGAANPFKDTQVPPPVIQPKPLHQAPLRAKKSCVSSGQIRRATPPLTVSPSSIPLLATTSIAAKVHKAPRSPLVSPPLKDLATIPAPFHVSTTKEQCKESLQVALHRDLETDYSTRSISPVTQPSTMMGQSSSSYSAPSEQSGVPCSPLYTEQSTFSAPVSPATFQHNTNDSNSQLISLPLSSANKLQCLSQPSSPPATKRRKTFPRRVSSSSQQLRDQSESSLNVSDCAKELFQDSPEPTESETSLKDVSVKIEQGIDHEDDEEETYSQENFTETGVEGAKYYDQVLEGQVVMDEDTGDGLGMPSNQPSMLQRSLSGQMQGASQNDENNLKAKNCFLIMGPKYASDKPKGSGHSLTMECKKEIISEYERGVRIVDTVVKHDLTRSPVLEILKKNEKIKRASVRTGMKILKRSSLNEEMEKLLVIWINECCASGNIISQEMICRKARMIYEDLKKHVTELNVTETEREFKGSNGWFEKFKRRSGIFSVIRYGKRTYQIMKGNK